jgi:hypothetical protein
MKYSDIKPLIKPLIIGLVAGSVATMIVGFAWGGWVTGGSATLMAKKEANTAVITALAPICVLQFKGQPEAAAQLVALKGLGSYQQGDFVEKTGAANMPGTDKSSNGVAKACANLLVQVAN